MATIEQSNPEHLPLPDDVLRHVSNQPVDDMSPGAIPPQPYIPDEQAVSDARHAVDAALPPSIETPGVSTPEPTNQESYDPIQMHNEVIATNEAVDRLAEKLHVRDQVAEQTHVLTQAGLLEQLSTGELGIIDREGEEYPMPTADQVAALLKTNYERVASKEPEGFTKLLLVPFAHHPQDLLDAYGAVIEDRLQTDGKILDDQGEVAALKPDETLMAHLEGVSEERTGHITAFYPKKTTIWLDEGRPREIPVKPSSHSFVEELSGEIVENTVYYPEKYTIWKNGGRSKEQIIGNELPVPGWQIAFVRDNAKTDLQYVEYKSVLGTARAGYAPRTWLKTLRKNFPDHTVTGFTPELWATYGITRLVEHGELIDYTHGSYLLESASLGGMVETASTSMSYVDRRPPFVAANLRQLGNKDPDTHYGVRLAVQLV